MRIKIKILAFFIIFIFSMVPYNAMADFTNGYNSVNILGHRALKWNGPVDFSGQDIFNVKNLSAKWITSIEYSNISYSSVNDSQYLRGHYPGDGTTWINSGDIISLAWSKLDTYPAACSSSQTITGLDDSITCTAISILSSQVSDFVSAVNSLISSALNSKTTTINVNTINGTDINGTRIRINGSDVRTDSFNSTYETFAYNQTTPAVRFGNLYHLNSTNSSPLVQTDEANLRYLNRTNSTPYFDTLTAGTAVTIAQGNGGATISSHSGNSTSQIQSAVNQTGNYIINVSCANITANGGGSDTDFCNDASGSGGSGPSADQLLWVSNSTSILPNSTAFGTKSFTINVTSIFLRLFGDSVWQKGIQVIDTITLGAGLTGSKTNGTQTISIDTAFNFPFEKTNIAYFNQSQLNATIYRLGVNATTITCSGTDKISAYNNATGVFTCSSDQTGGGSSEWTGANVTTTTCSGTDKISAINNATGEVTCSADQTGSGGGGGTALNESTDWIVETAYHSNSSLGANPLLLHDRYPNATIRPVERVLQPDMMQIASTAAGANGYNKVGTGSLVADNFIAGGVFNHAPAATAGTDLILNNGGGTATNVGGMNISNLERFYIDMQILNSTQTKGFIGCYNSTTSQVFDTIRGIGIRWAAAGAGIPSIHNMSLANFTLNTSTAGIPMTSSITGPTGTTLFPVPSNTNNGQRFTFEIVGNSSYRGVQNFYMRVTNATGHTYSTTYSFNATYAHQFQRSRWAMGCGYWIERPAAGLTTTNNVRLYDYYMRYRQ